MGTQITKKLMGTSAIIEAVKQIKLGQYLIISCKGIEDIRSSVLLIEHNKITLFNGGIIQLSPSGWVYIFEGQTYKVLSLDIDEACKNCSFCGSDERQQQT